LVIATQQVQTIEIKRRVAHYLWKSISNETLKFIETCRIKNLLDYIGIHIRKGDKLLKEAREIPINRYIKAIERILHRNKTIQQIFVASDNHEVVNELRKLKPAWKFISIHDQNHHTTNRTSHFQSHFNRLSEKEKLFETRLFMCELQMLIDSQYVLCAMSSNVCRLVQILRHQHPSTAISLDRSWYAT
jgi:Alpha-(1,6)-fucosyltransferase N- and catalytic domains